jgi:hypothetical protein
MLTLAVILLTGFLWSVFAHPENESDLARLKDQVARLEKELAQVKKELKELKSERELRVIPVPPQQREFLFPNQNGEPFYFNGQRFYRHLLKTNGFE